MKSAATIRAVDVNRRFGRRRKTIEALGPVDIEIPPGQFVSIVGPSGCGKSTLLRVLAGITRPSEGSVELEVGESNPLSMVFQDYGVYPWKTVLENVRFGLDCAGVARRDADSRATAWLERTQLADFADAWPSQLSGGMRQRVAIARALVTEPELMLLDEPFAALDPQLRSIMQDELLSLTQSNDTEATVVMVTHSLAEAVYLSDRVLVMSARPGRILEDAEVPLGRPRGPEARTDPAFAVLENRLWEILKHEVVTDLEEVPS